MWPSSFVDGSGTRLAVYEDGAPDRDPVVLLHGGPGVPDYLGDVSTILAGEHRVIRFDQRGTGRSTCVSRRYALQDYVADLEAIRTNYRLERLALFGHSWGGMLAQLYAARYPNRVARLCLCNSSVGVGRDWRAMERAVMAHNRRRGGLVGFMHLGLEQALAMLPGTIGDQAARRMMAQVWCNYFDPPESAPPPSPEWLAGIHRRPIFVTRRAALSADPAEIESRLSVPVLILFGETDIYGQTIGRLISRFPSARVVIMPRAGHVPWLQNRPEFTRQITTFFRADSRFTDATVNAGFGVECGGEDDHEHNSPHRL